MKQLKLMMGGWWVISIKSSKSVNASDPLSLKHSRIAPQLHEFPLFFFIVVFIALICHRTSTRMNECSSQNWFHTWFVGKIFKYKQWVACHIWRKFFEGKWSVSPYFLHYYQDNNEAGMLSINKLSLKTLGAYVFIIFWLKM